MFAWFPAQTSAEYVHVAPDLDTHNPAQQQVSLQLHEHMVNLLKTLCGINGLSYPTQSAKWLIQNTHGDKFPTDCSHKLYKHW